MPSDDVPSRESRPEHPTISTSLLHGAKGHDAESWSRLVTTFGPVVYGWARASGVNESEAADIVQDVFVSVARGIKAFERKKESGSFRSWLATITRNRVRDYHRTLKSRDQAIGGTDAWQRTQAVVDEVSNQDEFESTITGATAASLINQSVLASVQAEFEPTTWQAFWLSTIQEKTGAEAAQALGISVASVYQAKSRILRRLRQRLSELPD